MDSDGKKGKVGFLALVDIDRFWNEMSDCGKGAEQDFSKGIRSPCNVICKKCIYLCTTCVSGSFLGSSSKWLVVMGEGFLCLDLDAGRILENPQKALAKRLRTKEMEKWDIREFF